MYFSSADDGKKFLEDGRRQSNVPQFNVLQDTDRNSLVYSGNGPKQTNASAYSGKGTLSRSQWDAFGCDTRSSGRSRAQMNGASSRDYNSKIQSDERDVLDTMFEEPNRMLSDSERNISEDHWFSHRERIHPSSKTNLRLGIPHPHQQSRLSTEGSFHLSHLEGDSVSEGSDEMEYSSGSDHVPPVQRTSEVYLSRPRFTDTSRDARPRSRRTNGTGQRNPSSKHDGLSWQQYKALATRRKEAQSHTGRMDVEGMNGRSFASPENPFRTSADIQRHEFEVRHEPDDRRRGFPLDGLTGQHSPSPLSRSALDTFYSQADPSGDDLKHSRDARMSTLVDGHDEFDPAMNVFEDCEFEQEYMQDGRIQRPHTSRTKRHYPSPFYSQIEEGNARPDLGEFVPPRPTVDRNTLDSQTTSIYSISEFQRAEFHRVSKRTNIQRPQGPRQVGNSIISRTNSSDSDVDLSEHRILNAHSQNHEQVQSVLPAVLEQKQSGAHLTIQSLPPSSLSALDRTASGNTSSLDLKRPRRRKLETEFSNSQASPSEDIRTRQFAGGEAKPLRLSGRTDLNVQPDFLGHATVHDPELSSLLSSDFMGTSVQEDRRISSRQLQEPDYLPMHQQEGHNSRPNQRETGSKGSFHGTPESLGNFRSVSVSQSDAHVVHPQRTAPDVLKSSRSTTCAYPEGFDPVHDLLTFSTTQSPTRGPTTKEPTTQSTTRGPTTKEPTTQSTTKGPTNAKAANLHSMRSHEPSGVRTTNDYSSTTSKGFSSQYSSALSSYSVQSLAVLDKLPLQTTSALEGHLAQHYTNTGFSSANHRLESYENVPSYLNQSAHRSTHSNHSKLDHQSCIKTAADADDPQSFKRNWYQLSGSHSTSFQHEDLQDFLSEGGELPFSLQERRIELQRAMNYHSEEEPHQDLYADTSSRGDKLLRCSADTASKIRGSLSEMSFSPGGSPRHITSILWVYKLLDILHNHPVEKHEVLVSQAYWFRRWLSKVRLLKMIRQEEKDKWRRAVIYHNISLQQKCLRQWMAGVQSRSKSARLLYQHRLLRKGLSAFRFAVMSSKVVAVQLETRLKITTLAKYFNKWSALTQLRKEKEAILEQIAYQHVTVRAFSAWKEGYHAQQRMGIADLHYKVGLLSRSIEGWKTYLAHRRKKFYQTEVARVYHEDSLVKRAWVTMATICGERQKARRQYRRSMLRRSWRACRSGIQIIKMENLHDNAKAVVFRNRAILQRLFADWKEKANVSMVTHRREKSQLSQAFELWKLKHHRRQVLYRILDSKDRKTRRKRAFLAWREHTQRSAEAQREGVRLIERVQTGVVMSAWRSWTSILICRRQTLQHHLTVRNARTVVIAFRWWKLCWLRERAIHQGLERWSERCLKRAAQRWKQHVLKRRQWDQAEELVKQSENACLRRSFSQWVKAKAQADHERQRAADMHSLLISSQLHRTFLAWRLEMMVTRAVRPLTQRRKKRCLAKAFDSWRDIITRRKMGRNFAERCKNSITAITFRCWRNQTESRLHAKQEQDSLEASLILGCFQAWKRLHQRETTRRTVAKQRETECLRQAFASWRAQAVEAELEREIQMGKEKRRFLLQKLFFKAWRRASGEEAELGNERCSMIQDRHAASTLLKMWKRWRRSLELELKARSLAENNQRQMLEESFLSWHRHTQQSMSAAVESFHARLNESCSSLQSPEFPASFPPSQSPSSSSSSSSSSCSLSPPSPALLLSKLQAHGMLSPCASSPSPLREVSVNLQEELYTEFSHSVMNRIAVEPSVWPGSAEDIAARDATPHGQDPSVYTSLDRIISRTPSPLRNLHPGNSTGDQEDADFVHPIAFEVKGQLESGEGSVVSLDQGAESSGRSIDSHPSHVGVSSIADSGYHANGFMVFSNGESQLDASSDSTSVKSVKDTVSSTDVLRMSPHKNNNNSASQLLELSQHREEWVGLTKLWCSTEDPPGQTEDGYPFLKEIASPGSPLGCHSGSVSSRVGCFPVQHGDALHRCTNAIRNTSDMDMIGIDGGTKNFPAEAYVETEDDDDDDGEDDDDDGEDGNDVHRYDDNISNGSLGSGKSLRTHEKSTVQFINQQRATAINNKKAYMTSVILRLRLWPASAAFYQWLQYTRLKKMHREYRALVEGRMNDVELRGAFQHWRQHSSDSQLAASYLNKRLMERYFSTWSCFKERESKGEIQTALAIQHATSTLLKSAWNRWKEHFLQSLYPIGPRPSWSAHFNQSKLLSHRCASFQAQTQGRNVKECLMFWRLRWRQLEEADGYRSKVILKRCLRAWRSWSQEKRWREDAARIILEARRKKMAFRRWRMQLAKLDLVHTHYHGAANNHLSLIIQAWHGWAETTKRLRLTHQIVTQRCHAALVNEAWLSWKQEAEKTRRGQTFQNGKILHRTFSGWKSVIHGVKRHRLVMDSIQSRKKRAKLSACFKLWQMEYKARRFAVMQEHRQARSTLTKVLTAWKMFVAERRCERQEQNEVLQEAFSIWRNQYLETKRRKQVTLSAATHWRHLVRRSRELTETMNLFRSSVEERKLLKTFIWWQRSWISHQLSHRFYGNTLLSRSMQGLKELLQRSRRHSVLEQHFVYQRRKNLLKVYFRKWKDRQSHMTYLHVTAAKVKGELADRSLGVAFLMWRLRYRERQTEHSFKHKLMLKTWQTWRGSQANYQKAESMREEREKSLLRQSFNALRNWARDHSGRRIVLHCVQTRKNHFTLKTTFAVWRDESRLRQLAKDHHNMCIQRSALCRVLIAWRSFSQKRKVLNALRQKVACQVSERRQREALRMWKGAYLATKEAEAKRKEEAALLTRCFSDWRNEVHEVQAQRLRERRRRMKWAVSRWRKSMERKKLIRQYESDLEELAVLHWDHGVRRGYFNKWRSTLQAVRHQRRQCFLEQKYGLLWKQHVTQMLMAEAMARYLKLERCWKAWRKRFIMDRVSREMLEQDQRMLLTKVFHRWHQLTVLQRMELGSKE